MWGLVRLILRKDLDFCAVMQARPWHYRASLGLEEHCLLSGCLSLWVYTRPALGSKFQATKATVCLSIDLYSLCVCETLDSKVQGLDDSDTKKIYTISNLNHQRPPAQRCLWRWQTPNASRASDSPGEPFDATDIQLLQLLFIGSLEGRGSSIKISVRLEAIVTQATWKR